MTNIEALKEILESLRITEEYTSDRNRITEPTSSREMLMVSIPVVYNKIA